MPEWTVSWSVEVDGDDPREAAIAALRMQRDPESTATVFEVSPFRTVWTLFSEAVALLQLIGDGGQLDDEQRQHVSGLLVEAANLRPDPVRIDLSALGIVCASCGGINEHEADCEHA